MEEEETQTNNTLQIGLEEKVDGTVERETECEQ